MSHTHPPSPYVNLVQNRCVWRLCTHVPLRICGKQIPYNEHTWITISESEKLYSLPFSNTICILCGRQALYWVAFFFFSSKIFPLVHSSFPAEVRVGTSHFWTWKSACQPFPRAMASLQSQLCNGAPWLWRNPPGHKVSLVNSWELW